MKISKAPKGLALHCAIHAIALFPLAYVSAMPLFAAPPASTHTDQLTDLRPVASASATTAKAALSDPLNVRPSPSPQVQGVREIRLERGPDAETRVVLELNDSHVPIDLQHNSQKITARILNQPLSPALIQRRNLVDDASVVRLIESFNADGHGMVEIHSNARFDYSAYQANKKLIIRIKAKKNQSDQVARFRGKKISLDFQDIEVRRVLQVLSEFSGFNMVASDAVQGNITLNLKNVPWDEALELILSTKGLDKRIKGSTYLIAPTAELIKSDEETAKLMAQSVRVSPLQTEYIALNYAKASDLVNLIRDTRVSVEPSAMLGRRVNRSMLEGDSADASAEQDEKPAQYDVQGSLLSSRGRVSVDQRTNTLIVSDTPSKIEQIRKMIDILDVPVKQVMIEARIVRANTDVSREMGVKWGFLSRGSDVHTGGSSNTLWDLRTPNSNTQAGQPKYTIRQNDYLNVDLGVTAAGASRIAFGVINISNTLLDLELSALQADGAAEVISTPKVMTADKQKAKVASGQQIPYQTREQASQGDRSITTSFKDALLSMDVTPSITPDGRVQMALNINNDSPSGIAPNGDLIINKNAIETNVLVKNGETIVLGGVFEQDTRKRQTRVPILGQIPVLGQLFRRDEKSDKKSELLIFVTPRIVNDSAARNH